MNERIKELAKQSGYTPLPGFDFANSLQEVFIEKFAELIVRECAKLSKDKANHIASRAEKFADDEDELTSAQAIAWQFLVLEAEIKKHFGVEE